MVAEAQAALVHAALLGDLRHWERGVARTLAYSDAVRLLGGANSPVVDLIDRVTGGVLLAATGGVPAVLGWFDAKTEFVRLCHQLVNGLAERRTGLSRYDRTRRLEAAHSVLVVVAFFEALEQAPLPFPFGDLALTVEDKLGLATGVPRLSSEGNDIVAAIQGAGSLLPDPRRSYSDQVVTLGGYYQILSSSLLRFVTGLEVWDRHDRSARHRFTRAVENLPPRASQRYEELLRRLAADFPEVACWVNVSEHRATRGLVRQVDAALAGLQRRLEEIAAGRAPDERRTALTRAYRAALDRAVVATGSAAGGLSLPTLGEAYVDPLFRLAGAAQPARLSDESWWRDQPVRDDLEDFLLGYLTCGHAVRAPLLVLGQPGSGKSLLTQALAARLPASDFLPLRVVLREAPAEAAVQDQIEYAVRAQTGERVDWPALSRSAGDALPVVFLDGFDELLQATGVSQTDYLTRVVDFQRREADQGRPVAVVVTSRTAVADRARTPEGSTAMRLEPFDESRVRRWLDTWNRANRDHFRNRGLAPLAPETVLAHPQLAEQPLLLLMLALYDADDNDLQHSSAELGEGALYEQLLRAFARRETVKHRPGLPDRDIDAAVEEELRRLSIVALAMFNRGTQWVTEADLESDLLALFGSRPAPPRQDFRAPLRAAEAVLGRFFFVHRAQVSRHAARIETYEFLHATFGEFLTARLTWQILRDIAAREAVATMSLSGEPGDDLLHAVLSFAPISQRIPILDFLTGMASGLAAGDRAALTDLLLRLFRAVHQPRPGRGYPAYQPRPLPVPARHAAYSANLVLLLVCVAGSVRARDLFGDRDLVPAWAGEVLLWRSQLLDGWFTIVQAVDVHREWDGSARELRLVRADGTARSPTIDPHWTYGVAPDADSRHGSYLYTDQDPVQLRRSAHFLCRTSEDVIHHALEPLTATVPIAINTIIGWDLDPAVSAVHALLDVWTVPLREPSAERRRQSYELCARIATHRFPPWPETSRTRYAALLLDRLATDRHAPPDLVADVLARIVNAEPKPSFAQACAVQVLQCGLAFLGRSRGTDPRLIDLIATVSALPGVDDALLRQARFRISEAERGPPPRHDDLR